MNYMDSLYVLEVKYLTLVANLVGKQLGSPFKVREHRDGIILEWENEGEVFSVIFQMTKRDDTHAIVEINPVYGNGILRTTTAYAIEAPYVAKQFLGELKKRNLVASVVSDYISKV